MHAITHSVSNKHNANRIMLVVMAFGLAVRLLAVNSGFSYENDVYLFQYWAVRLQEQGFSHFYGGAAFADYPPLYMYALRILGMIRAYFNWPFLSIPFNLLICLPAIICDILLGWFLYARAAATGVFSLRVSCGLASAYIFNPATILDSAIWCQVDAVYTLILFVSLYAVYKNTQLYNKNNVGELRNRHWLLVAYLLYGAAILTKPQSLFLGPVYLYSAYDFLRTRHFTARNVGLLAVYILSALILMLLLAFPFAPGFDFAPVLMQYIGTLESYAYGSVNAYNFFAFIGGNWQPITDTFFGIPYATLGIVFIVLITVTSLVALHKDHAVETSPIAPSRGGQLFIIAAALNVFAFMFSVKMHERYYFPALAFLLIAYIEQRDKRVLALFTAFSVTFCLNCGDVLRMLHTGNRLETVRYSQPVISCIHLLLTIMLAYIIATTLYRREKKDIV